jgi:hypothetical protein
MPALIFGAIIPITFENAVFPNQNLPDGHGSSG